MGWQPPVVLKPVRQGSSVGLQFVERVEEFKAALTEALRYDSQILMEEQIVGRETTVGILDGQALPVVEVRPRRGGYDYRNKYTVGATEYFCPAPFPSAVTARIQAAGLAAFQAIGGRDYGRVDIMVSADSEPVVLEVNTLPGMTETSFAKGRPWPVNFFELCQRMVDLAQSARYRMLDLNARSREEFITSESWLHWTFPRLPHVKRLLIGSRQLN